MKKYSLTKYACFLTCFATAVTANLSPVLFLTFKNMYGLSYSLLGLLVVINFGTQLFIDLVFSFFSHKFNLAFFVKLTPVIMAIGFALFGLAPLLFPKNVYLGLAISTVVFSLASGLAEVLISPTIASLPSKNPERLLSRLHSCYAWGVVVVVLISTLFLYFVGTKNWIYLAFIFALLPLTASALFLRAPIPVMETPKKTASVFQLLKKKEMILSIVCIFLGGASECAMSQWCSGYLEQAFGLPKIQGDIFGVALFGVMLGIGRTLYSKFGKNASKVLIFGAIGTTICYIVACLSPLAVVGLIACAMTGFFASMLWPGSLIVASDCLPEGGVSMYALMASGGDLGASVCPQLVGVVADAVLASEGIVAFGASLSFTADEIAMKFGLGLATLFPLLAIPCFVLLKKYCTAKKKQAPVSK